MKKIKPLKLKTAERHVPIQVQMVMGEIEKLRSSSERLSHPTTAIGTINFGKELAYKNTLLLLKAIKW